MEPISYENISSFIDGEFENYTIISLDDNSSSDKSYENKIILEEDDERRKTTINYKIFEQPVEEDQSSLLLPLDLSQGKVIDLSTIPIIDVVPQPVRIFQNLTPCRRGRPPKTSTPLSISAFQNSLNSTSSNSFRLNSSGEETSTSEPSLFIKVPNNSPNDQLSSLNSSDSFYFPRPYNRSVSQLLSSVSGDAQVNHCVSERKRRNRIKNACVELRRLIPSLTEKSDNATVLERTVDFLFNLKQTNADLFQENFKF